jgi:serine/threonine-protein kinase
MPLVSGATAAGFKIVRLLGCGAIGEVYLAEHPRLPRPHALKILPADISADPEYRERFNRESDLAAALWHPHIVGLHDRGEFDGRLWLSLDYVDGPNAAQLLSDTYPDGMPPDEVVEIVTAIADALDYAHDHGLLHRHVKPGNILITEPESDRRRILLADFGVARRFDDIDGLTPKNMTVGTVSYAAPEQLMGDSIDGRADQYALAGTAFHLLTGSPPFAHSNPAVVIGKHLNEPPPRPGDIRPELARFDEPFARALAKAPGDRFPRCQDFAKALEANRGKPSAPPDDGATAVITPPSSVEERLPAAALPVDAESDAEAPTGPAADHLPDSETDTAWLTEPVLPSEAEDFAIPADLLPDNRIRDDITSPDLVVPDDTTDDTPVTSRHRRLVQTAAFALPILVVALAGFLIVTALRSASGFQQTPTNVETTSSVAAIPPAPPARATATPPPPVTAPAAKTTTPAASTTLPSPPATTRQLTSTPPVTRPAFTKPTSSPALTPPAGIDTRPAPGMPCGAQQSGTTTVSNTGVSVSCVGTPGGFAWEPPGG